MSGSDQHLAAVLHSKGSRHSVEYRPTPQPGPDDILVEVKSIALNPVDVAMRDIGFRVAAYPAVLGSDVAGTVISVGSSVPTDLFQPGTRVAGFAPAYAVEAAPDYGAFQSRVLIPAVNSTPLPEGISFNEAALLPMAVYTARAGFYVLGIEQDKVFPASEKKGLLVWGASSSIGSATVQHARMAGLIVYATASEKHHEYIKSLGATKVFDYHSDDVVGAIIKAAKEDGVEIQLGYDAIGRVRECFDILKVTKGSGVAKLATSRLPDPNAPTVEGVNATFIAGPEDPTGRTAFFRNAYNVWLKEKLETKEFVPSPRIQVVSGSLKGIDQGLEDLKNVSATKLVLEL